MPRMLRDSRRIEELMRPRSVLVAPGRERRGAR